MSYRTQRRVFGSCCGGMASEHPREVICRGDQRDVSAELKHELREEGLMESHVRETLHGVTQSVVEGIGGEQG